MISRTCNKKVDGSRFLWYNIYISRGKEKKLKSKFKKNDRIKIRAHVQNDWLYGHILRGHPDRQKIVVRLDDGSLRAWPRIRVHKV